MIRAVLTDIEGTTTSISFVVDVLFPYARKHITRYIQEHADDPEVRILLDEVVSIGKIENNLDAISQQLIQWIDEDKKITPLKALQGMIWKAGYETGDFKGHVYADVAPTLRKWHEQGIKLYVFSSGSVAAQKLIFGYSEAGDLTPLFSGYFDTRIGNKRESNAYKNIINEIDVEAKDILFLSDIEEELNAAKKSGINTLQLTREGMTASTMHTTVKSFNEIKLDG